MYTRDNSHVIIVLDDSNYDKDGCCCSKNRIVFQRTPKQYVTGRAHFCKEIDIAQYAVCDIIIFL